MIDLVRWRSLYFLISALLLLRGFGLRRRPGPES